VNDSCVKREMFQVRCLDEGRPVLSNRSSREAARSFMVPAVVVNALVLTAWREYARRNVETSYCSGRLQFPSRAVDCCRVE
jgi:hypothetical protein